MREPEFGRVTIERLRSVFDYIYDFEETKQKIAVIGFCFGGSYSYSLSTIEPRLKLALPFYGHADQSVEELSKIKCPVRAFYGENDYRLIEGLVDLKERMKEAGVDYKVKVYKDSGHAFFNDSNSKAYNKEAATDAWNEVITELDKLN